uniref:Uncharacterized protein n=1 Tax=Myotis myotis TaxID=51298 RepID=A0A7J7VX62_MYOMY|nr:hypothetical protein mMyoMyo1_001808 [Myotis myotis]
MKPWMSDQPGVAQEPASRTPGALQAGGLSHQAQSRPDHDHQGHGRQLSPENTRDAAAAGHLWGEAPPWPCSPASAICASVQPTMLLPERFGALSWSPGRLHSCCFHLEDTSLTHLAPPTRASESDLDWGAHPNVSTY